MGYILFAAPGLRRLHLHQLLARALVSRGHRVAVLSPDRPELETYGAQGLATERLMEGKPRTGHAPLEEFAARDQLLGPACARPRRAAEYARVLGGVTELFERDRPDFVMLHQERSGLHQLLHFAAREFGCPILHTGDGMLPGTMQWDGEGIDGDAAVCRRSRREALRAAADEVLLRAALAGWLARSLPPPLARDPVCRPSLAARARAALRMAVPLRGREAWRCLRGWRRALPVAPPTPRVAPIPPPPFLAVLLQAPDDVRLLLDAGPDANSIRLAVHTAEVARRIDPQLRVVAVLPDRGMPAAAEAALQHAGILPVPAGVGPEVILTAIATVTINHPAAVGALLAGTPVLHTGRAPWAFIARRTSIDLLAADLAEELEVDREAEGQRFLTGYLGIDHVWCAADHPDHNGLNGLIAGIEGGLRAGLCSSELRYRPGPTWPLAPTQPAHH